MKLLSSSRKLHKNSYDNLKKKNCENRFATLFFAAAGDLMKFLKCWL